MNCDVGLSAVFCWCDGSCGLGEEDHRGGMASGYIAPDALHMTHAVMNTGRWARKLLPGLCRAFGRVGRGPHP